MGDKGDVHGLRRARVERTAQRCFAGGQLGQQIGADGEQVAAGQCRDLAHVAEARAHHFGGDAVPLVELVDAAHRAHARVVGASHGDLVPTAARTLLVPVVDAADERRDQLHPGLATGDRLGEGEQQGQVGVDAVAFKTRGGLNTLPRGGDLDQHAVDVHTLTLIQVDDAARARHGCLGVEAQAGVHFGGHAAGNEAQDFAAKAHQQAVHHLVQAVRSVLRHRILEQGGVLRHLHGLENERRVRGGIARSIGRELFEITGVRHDRGELFEGI